ncbi:MAG: dihydrofolate reductase, partial [Pseudomonadota bacterium]
MSITLVAAMGRNAVIGQDGNMPWHVPADLAHFKQVTMGHPVMMGRKTFE